MGRESSRQLSQRPHPATYILFRPPATPIDDEIFTDDLVTSQTRSLNYKKSCPALLGTASRRLERISESRYDDEDTSASDEDGSPVPPEYARLEPGAFPGCQTISKKRSFLLVDVIDNLEGRPPPKKQDTHDSGSVITSGSVEITGSQRRGRSLTRQRSDFDILFKSSRELACSSVSSPATRRLCSASDAVSTTDDHEKGPELSTRKDLNQFPARGRQPGLKSKKSMIALSLDRNRSASPSKHRLSEIDTHQITSFDTLLGNSDTALKADPSLNPVDIECSTVMATMPPVNSTSHLDEGVPGRRDFSRHTAMLKQMPNERPSARHTRQLRHTKSAKDILQSYSTNRTTFRDNARQEVDLVKRSDVSVKTTVQTLAETRASKRAAKQASLRDDLRSLLGMKKKNKNKTKEMI